LNADVGSDIELSMMIDAERDADPLDISNDSLDISRMRLSVTGTPASHQQQSGVRNSNSRMSSSSSRRQQQHHRHHQQHQAAPASALQQPQPNASGSYTQAYVQSQQEQQQQDWDRDRVSRGSVFSHRGSRASLHVGEPVTANKPTTAFNASNTSVGGGVVADEYPSKLTSGKHGPSMDLKRLHPVSLDEHTAAVTRLRAPVRTNNLLLSASLDGTIRIWGPEAATRGGGGDHVASSASRAVLDANTFKSDIQSSNSGSSSSGAGGGGGTAGGSERRISLGENNDAHSSGTTTSAAGGGTSSSSAATSASRGASVRITNLWADETCETIWAACSDATLRVWSGGEGRPLRLLKGHEDQITSMEGMDAGSSSASHLLQSSTSGAPSPCTVATGSADRTVRIWDVRAKKAQVFSFRGHGDTVLALRWGEGGRSLVSAGKDKTARIWDTRAGRLRATLEKHFGTVNCLRVIGGANMGFSKGGTGGEGGDVHVGARASIISAGRDSMINVWTSNGDCISSTAAHRGTVSFLSELNYGASPAGGGGASGVGTVASNYTAALAAGNPLMISLGTDNQIKLWDMKRFKCVSEISAVAAVSTTSAAEDSLTSGASRSATAAGGGAQVGNLSRAVWCPQGFITSSTAGAVRLYETGVLEGATTVNDGMGIHSSSSSGLDGVSPDRGGGTAGAAAGASGITTATGPGTGAGMEWSGCELATHAAGSGAGSGPIASTDLICTKNLLASSSKAGQVLCWMW